MLDHGGHLINAAEKYHIPLSEWIDLSTGINPNGWPVANIPAQCWQRLPETADGLVAAARQYYQCDSILPVAGSQAAIQALPLLRSLSKVGILTPGYAEHGYSWKKNGHDVIELSLDSIESQIHRLDVLIIINPNNPSGELFDKDQLLHWHQQIKQRGGWLIIDEAFIDTRLEYSLSSHSNVEGLIILKSIGKFFGLAGIRCGFVVGTEQILNSLNEKLGPWTVSHPSRYIATTALKDTEWHKNTRYALNKQSERMSSLLIKNNLKPNGRTDLFQWVKHSDARQIHQSLARQGVLTRLFKNPISLRFGLPKNEQQFLQLERSLNQLN